MILEKQNENILLEEGEVQGSTAMQIDADSHIFLMRMLSKFYSDGIGSLIRETASNALDSHRACGVEDPIIVGFKQGKDGNYEFSVEDFGCGIDTNDVDNIISKYGKSTKRNSNNQIGCFGLGFKSPLAYTSSFYFIGVKGGMERKWLLYEADDESNKIDLLYESPTDKRNGVKIIVPVKYNDGYNFIKKIKEQLAYFESVYFDCGSEVENDKVKIVRNEDFQWSSLISNDRMHLTLDNVYYPLDFEKIGITQHIYFPVALKFSLSDGIFPVPNREQLKFSEEAKTVIRNKIQKVAEYFVNKYNEGIKETDDIFNIIKHFSSNYRHVQGYNGNNLSVVNLEPYSNVKFIDPKLKSLKYLTARKVYDLKEYLTQEYLIKYNLSNGRFNASGNNNWKLKLQFRYLIEDNLYSFTDLPHLKKAYFRESIPNYTHFIRKEKDIPLGNVKAQANGTGYVNWINILGLHSHPRTEWRDRIKEAKHVTSLLLKRVKDADKIDVPTTWIEGRKKQKIQSAIVKGTNIRRKKLTGELTAKVSQNLERYVSGKSCKFVPEVIQMKDAHKAKKFIVYGNQENEDLFQKWYTIVNKTTKFAILSERELKNIKEVELHNWMHIDKFMEGKHKIFKRAVTAYLISKLKDEYSNVFSRIDKLKLISLVLAEKVEKLNTYQSNYWMDGNKELLDDIIKVAEENNLFDTKIYDVYKEIKAIFAKLPFIDAMFNSMTYSRTDKDQIKDATIDLFKYYKQRVNWENYILPINEIKEEIVLEEEFVV